jgi:plasmid stabilization system protein ParE
VSARGAAGVRATANFYRNLEEIEAFLEALESANAFDGLLAQLADEIIPSLERFPEIGSDFLARAPLSKRGLMQFEKAAKLLAPDASLRQLVVGDYVLLYYLHERTVYLLSIRHQRQLSFDFSGHWP